MRRAGELQIRRRVVKRADAKHTATASTASAGRKQKSGDDNGSKELNGSRGTKVRLLQERYAKADQVRSHFQAQR